MATVDDLFVHQIITPGQPGGISTAEAAAIRADQATILARPVISRFRDIPDVGGNPADGQIYAWDAATQTLLPVNPGKPLLVTDEAGESVANVGKIIGWRGVNITLPASGEPGAVYLDVAFAGSGTQFMAAHADHYHAQWVDIPLVIPATGTLSSGTRTLGSVTVTGMVPDVTYVLTGTMAIDLRGEGTGAGRSTPRLRLHTNEQARHVPARTVAGVDREATVLHDGIYISGVSQVTAVALVQYTDGDPIYINGGKMVVKIKPFR